MGGLYSMDGKDEFGDEEFENYEKAFEAAAAWVKETDMNATQDEKLECYKHYKQATEGDVKGSQPWAVQMEARVKWDAWNSVKGMSKEDAHKHYVDTLKEQRRKYNK